MADKTDFEKAQMIRRWILTMVGEVIAYQDWDDAFCVKHVRESSGLPDVDVTRLTASEMDALDFGKWDEKGLRLIPIWLYPHLRLGQSIECIDGEKLTVEACYMGPGGIDNDNRFGCIAYGSHPAVSEVSHEQ